MNECELNSDVESSRVCGVYRITNTINGKLYIGSSTDVKERFRDHRVRLKSGGHDNPHLQNSWRKYGSDAFRFEVVERCAPEMLEGRETRWILELSSHDDENGYNWSPWASKMHAKLSPDDVREMRRLRRENGTTYRELGEMFGVSQSTASRAVKGESWADVEGAVVDTYGTVRGGEANPNASLTSEQVVRIRTNITHTDKTQEFAEKYGVNAVTIRDAVTGKSYSSVSGAVSFCASIGGEVCKTRDQLLGYVGERHHKTKLTEADVCAMRTRRRETGASFAKIGAMYGVTKRNARRAIQGATWAHVTSVAPVSRG